MEKHFYYHHLNGKRNLTETHSNIIRTLNWVCVKLQNQRKEKTKEITNQKKRYKDRDKENSYLFTKR